MIKHAMVIITIAMLLLSGFMINPVIGESEITISNIGNTSSVDNEGDGNYTKIQNAIDNSSDGDTILVYSGIFHENIIVDKELFIIGIDHELDIGNDKGKPLIYGDNKDATIEVKADNCTIKGLNIKNGNIGIKIFIFSNNVIANNNITNNGLGILLAADSINNNISNNYIANNKGGLVKKGGIILNYVSDNIVYKNIFLNNAMNRGVFVDHGYRNQIIDNIFLENDIICVFSGFDHKIINNSINSNIEVLSNNITLQNNKIKHGVYLRFKVQNEHIITNNSAQGKPICFYKDQKDIFVPDDVAQVIMLNCSNCSISNIKITNIIEAVNIKNSKNILISKNDISYCYNNGIFIENSNQVNISKNKISYCYNPYYDLGYGINIVHSNNNEISNNNISNIRNNGIHLSNSGNNTIFNNRIWQNEGGIFLAASDTNSIYDNTILENFGYGIQLWTYSTKNNIFQNNIKDNKNGIIFTGVNNNNINNNIVETNSYSGILISSWDMPPSKSYNNIITKNIILENWIGVYIIDDENSIIRWNIIESNNNFGLLTVDSIVNARFNWWGSILGPSRTKLSLLGDRIDFQNGRIKVFPWLPFRNLFITRI